GARLHYRGSGPGGAVMSARKRARQRPAKTFMVLGRELTQEQHDTYQLELAKRRGIKMEGLTDSEEFALRNTLYLTRPSVQARKRFEGMDLYERARDATDALGSMRHFPLFHDQPPVRAIGNELILHIANELQAIEQELRGIHSAIAAEDAERA